MLTQPNKIVSNTILMNGSTLYQQEVNYKQEEWGDEDGEFELEEEEIQTEISENGTVHISSVQNTNGIEHIKQNEVVNQNLLSPQNSNSKKITYVSSTQIMNLQSPLSNLEPDNLHTTKYGRKVHKPVIFTLESKRLSQENKKSMPIKSIAKRQRNLQETSTLTPQNSLTINTLSNTLFEGKTKVTIDAKDTQRSVSDDIVCTVCHDGRSPKNNRIVLCDNCDIPFHQQCHNPYIEDRVVEIPTAEWLCLKCEEIQRGRKRRKVENGDTELRIETSSATSNNVNNIPCDISGNGLTEIQKITYLSSLPQRVLIDLILIAEKLHPDLPLYPADVREKIRSSSSTPNDNLLNVNNQILSTTPPPNQSFTPQISNTNTQLTQNNQTDPSRAHLPVVGVDLPSYEEMIVQALESIADPAGSAPRSIFEWMKSTYPLHKKFRASASQALQKAVKKERVFRIGTVYQLNPNYKPVKRIRRYFKKPQSPKEDQSNKGDVGQDDQDNQDNQDHQHGIYEIVARLDGPDNFGSVQRVNIDDHPNLSSSAESTSVSHSISNGHTEVISSEETIQMDDKSNKAVSSMINESSNPMGTIMQNQSILPPVRGHGGPSTLLPPPVQPTLPSLSSVAPYFNPGYNGNKSYPSYQYTQSSNAYNASLPAIAPLSRDDENIQNRDVSPSSIHLH
ncbi:hypothetical protein Glove_134g178 [Diversispora epigaea]|uniref:Histone H1 n=1 Tax=Diversispora epigaea TaxID=1348612 RepID=A0A397J1F6_9GLOM|nr:hypothetical protein Glove_134g178 [Diversispora epigaea]